MIGTFVMVDSRLPSALFAALGIISVVLTTRGAARSGRTRRRPVVLLVLLTVVCFGLSV